MRGNKQQTWLLLGRRQEGQAVYNKKYQALYTDALI